jgi:membrane protease YdiL (CAAX protease family)
LSAQVELPRAKWLILWLFAAVAAAPVSLRTLQRHGAGVSRADEVFSTVVSLLVYSAVLIGGPALHSRAGRIAIRDLYRAHATKRVLRLGLLAVPLTGMAAFTVYLLWAPLSLAFPELTQKVLFDASPSMFASSGTDHALANGLCLLSVAVVAPIAEECFFRGLLLRSWSREYGAVGAVIASSLIFALLHVDVLGGFVFAIVMCALYAKFQSIWAPTLVHAATNVVAWGMAALDASGVTPHGTAAELRGAWWIALLGLLLTLPWALRYRSDYGPMSSWNFEARS